MPTSTPVASLSPRDVIRLYCTFNRRLTRIVRATTGASPPVIEDACQVAWTGLICPGQAVEAGSARAWLIRTAGREALRLMRLEVRETSLERALEEKPHLRSATDAGLEEQVWRREQVHSVRLLSVRQQRLVWLRALGFRYEEIASYEGATTRSIRRQLERAHRRLRALDDVVQIDRAAA
jgi:RNA polymerase sigma factor (sigma-70 family)